MDTLIESWSNLVQGIPEITVKYAMDNNMEFTENTRLADDLQNVVTIPEGFHIASDSGTKVEEGIVIEDEVGNEFVWIPVGEYKVSTTLAEEGSLTNNLSRRTAETSSTLEEIEGDSELRTYGKSEIFYGEGNENSVAKEQIGAFKSSATNNGGFYIGRYEAGTEAERTSANTSLATPLVQAHKYPYTYVTRDQAKMQSETMYSGNEYVVSELISSYAYDTALNFICQTNEAGYDLTWTDDNEYGNILTGTRTKTGEYITDKYSNIYDFIGNCWEWTTEYSSEDEYHCVCRGGSYSDYSWPDIRYSDKVTNYYDSTAFRVQLYIQENGATTPTMQYTDVYVTRYSDGTLAFCSSETNNIVGKQIAEVYGNIRGMSYSISWSYNSSIGASTIETNTPWYDDREKITSVIFVDEIVPYSTVGWFAGFTALEQIENIENLNTSKVTDMEAMFSWCTKLKSLDLSSFDTSNVTSMYSMFYQATDLETIIFGEKWNTSKVTNMAYMMQADGTEMSLTSVVGLEYFDTSNVEDMSYMFKNCTQLTSLNLSSFDTSKVTNMANMFEDCYSLKTITVSKDKWNISGANTSNWMNDCSAEIIEV